MRTISIAIINFYAPLDRSFNERQILKIIDDLNDSANFIVFPEASLQGYMPFGGVDAKAYYHASGLICDETDKFLIELQKRVSKKNVAVIFGAIEKDNMSLYDSAIMVSKDAGVQVYRKSHLATNEPNIFLSGNSLFTFHTQNITVGFLLCYDKCFPEAARTLALRGAEILFFLNAWGYTKINDPLRHDDQSRIVFDIYDQARAVENQCVVASANQVGIIGTSMPNQIHFLGSSKIVLPNGAIMGALGEEEDILIKTIDLDSVLRDEREDNENAMNLIKHRRPNLYQL